jgi:flagellar motor switch protein FliN/FliY
MNENKASTAQLVELPKLHHTSGHGHSILSGNLDVIGNVKVRLSVRIGEAVVSVSELMSMKQEHVLKLDADLDAPVDVLLEGNVVARGQLVAVDDSFGVRITELPRVGQP